MNALIVIPARWGSTRFPGKPLAKLGGRTVLDRTAANARAAATGRPGVSVVIATDHCTIADHAESLGHDVILTDTTISNGTQRALAAARRSDPAPSVIVNLQGDSPFTPPATLTAIIDAVAAGAAVATPILALDWGALDRWRNRKRHTPFSGTSCILDARGRALWFSKSIIPAIRDEERLRQTSGMSPIHRHIGLYGYTRAALETFCAAPPSPYETIEGLEQLRFFEVGVPIQTVSVLDHQWAMSGIDTPADLEAAETLLRQHGEPDWF